MEKFLEQVIERLEVEPKVLVVYLLLYWAAGFANDQLGRSLKIAWFPRRWHVLTCYGLYMVPASLYVRDMPSFDQYLYGLFFLSILEFTGYIFKRASINPDKTIWDKVFQRSNLSLGMVIYFAAYLPAGNFLAARISKMIF
jgi:hypothetical protein